MDLDRILLGFDFSDHSELALAAAVDLAAKTGAELTLLHVLSASPKPIVPSADADEIYGRRDRELQGEARRHLDAIKKRVSELGVEVAAVVADGRPYEAIRACAADRGSDLVVVGHRGLHGFQRLLLGSVAERVVRTAPASVLVARGGSPGRAGYRRILVAVDLSERSAPVIAAAIRLASPEAQIEVLHRYEVPAGATLPSYRRSLEEGARELGSDLVSTFSALHAGLSLDLEEGRPARGVVQRLERGRYDLVVLGSHRRGGLRRWLLGSVAEAVVRHAPCSALVVRGRGEERSEP